MNNLKLASRYTKKDVKNAIEIIGAECLGALQFANALSGHSNTVWDIINNNTWADIVEEGKAHGLDFESMKCAVTDTPLMWSGNIQRALGLITEHERKMLFFRHVKVDGKWPEPNK